MDDLTRLRLSGMFGYCPRHEHKPDDVAAELRRQLAAALEPPIDPAWASKLSDLLADHIRNKHRAAIGAELYVARWDRDAPEQVPTITERAA